MRVRRGVAIGFILCLFIAAGAVQAYERETFTTGRDWTDRMSETEKFIALIPPAILFDRYDVPLRRSLPAYIPMIDRVMLWNPQLADEDVANIFASTVYMYEPESRAALKRMETEFLQGRYEPGPLAYPELSLRDSLKELSI